MYSNEVPVKVEDGLWQIQVDQQRQMLLRCDLKPENYTLGAKSFVSQKQK